jgi:hypothetical protein
VFAVEAHDVGTARIHDACLLPGGQVLAALGEAGVVMRSRDGRPVAHFEAPAHRLVLADAGDRAIAVALRGNGWRLGRLDLVRRTVQEWCDARFHAFADTYDGARWFVADSGGLWAIDTFGAGFDGPWRVPDVLVPTVVGGIARSRSRCCVLDATSQQVWSYELPAYVLRARRGMPPGGGGMVLALSPQGRLVRHDLHEDGGPLLAWTASEESWDHEESGAAGERPGPVAASQRWIAAATFDAHGARVRLRDTAAGVVRAEMSLAAALAVSLRLLDELLVVADDRGRVLALDLDQGWLLRDLRI